MLLGGYWMLVNAVGRYRSVMHILDWFLVVGFRMFGNSGFWKDKY